MGEDFRRNEEVSWCLSFFWVGGLGISRLVVHADTKPGDAVQAGRQAGGRCAPGSIILK